MDKKRNSKGQFVKGSPKIGGRKKGVRNKSTEIIEAIGTERVEKALVILDAKLKAKDMEAVKIVLKHFGPRERPVQFTAPEKIETYLEAANYYVQILRETAKGRLTPGEGAKIASIVSGLVKALVDAQYQRELREVNNRLDELVATGTIRRK